MRMPPVESRLAGLCKRGPSEDCRQDQGVNVPDLDGRLLLDNVNPLSGRGGTRATLGCK
jgi:hypothetical protein